MGEFKIIARVHNDFKEKFGIPRQSGLADIESLVVFEPEFRCPEAVRGLEEFSHIWILWQFSKNLRRDWSPTVRPPRLGGNKRIGVFATRSSFRPNSIAMSSVKLNKIEIDKKLGPVLYISGADCLDGTPVFDIKPYLSYTDSHPDAVCGFADRVSRGVQKVIFENGSDGILTESQKSALKKILALDPRPSYQNDPERTYGFRFGDFEIRFKTDGSVINVTDILRTV